MLHSKNNKFSADQQGWSSLSSVSACRAQKGSCLQGSGAGMQTQYNKCSRKLRSALSLEKQNTKSGWCREHNQGKTPKQKILGAVLRGPECLKVKSLSRVRLFVPPPPTMDCSLPGSSIHGIFQARVLEWVAISFSRASSQPGDRTWVFPHCRQTLYCLSHQGILESLHSVYIGVFKDGPKVFIQKFKDSPRVEGLGCV